METPHLDALRRDGVSFSNMLRRGGADHPGAPGAVDGAALLPLALRLRHPGAVAQRRGAGTRSRRSRPPSPSCCSERGYKTCLIGDVYHIFKPTQNFTRGFFNYEFVRGQETDNWKGGHARPDPGGGRSAASRATLDPARHAPLVQYLLNKRHFAREADLTGAAVVQRGMCLAARRTTTTGRSCCGWSRSTPTSRGTRRGSTPTATTTSPGSKKGVEFIYPPEAARIGTAEEQERTKALYYGEITFMDAVIGRLLNTLADLGRLEDTVVMVTCDHGTELLDHGRFGKSADHLYAHNTRLNWIVRLPDGHPQGPGRAGAGDRRLRPEPRHRPHRARPARPARPLAGRRGRRGGPAGAGRGPLRGDARRGRGARCAG